MHLRIPVHRRHPRHPRHHRGFSLIEVLVTLVLLGVGLLGAQQMHATALRQHRDTQQQARADQLAADLAERIRANPAIARLPGSPYLLDMRAGAAPSLPSPDCITAPCETPEQAAAYDLADWQQQVAQALPGARIQVCANANPVDAQGETNWACTSSSAQPARTLVIKLGWSKRPGEEPVQPRTVLVASTGAPSP
ncbi:type IV pilus modification protein PilV [Brachymonas denitrificans]|uniref:type IV pilus modification protein PilV n=1 Tax=Brachymonas denitrificans TaxID=28220 RepID=UPI001BCDDC5B|nr:type IV pilus modification protein PilV [Brachymonas denitrificans]